MDPRNWSDPELHRIVDQGPDPVPGLDLTFEIQNLKFRQFFLTKALYSS
jgi:hypothetical protein